MCLIAYVPKGKSLSREIIDNANRVNPDGIGVMSEKGIEKFFGNKALKRARNYINALAAEEIPHAVHWRFATHGSRQTALCHPFKLPNAEAYLMHNGVISETCREATSEASDTLLYVNKLTDAPATYAKGDNLDYWNKVCNSIGQHNKCVVMYPGSNFIILNQDHGYFIDGIWYSNQYSLPKTTQTNDSHFVPARLRPASSWSGQGWYGYDTRTGQSYTRPSGQEEYSRRNWNDPTVSPFGDIIYWSKQFNCYGFWVGSKFQKLVVYEGATVFRHDLTPDPKPAQGTLDMTKDVSGTVTDDRKCPRCMRFKKDPPAGFMACMCSDDALSRYYANLEGKIAAHAKPAMPSGPSLSTGEHPEAKPAPKPSSESLCDHGNDNWENCRECIAELEADNASEVQQWLADRAGHRWTTKIGAANPLSVLDNPSDRADQMAEVICLPRASER